MEIKYDDDSKPYEVRCGGCHRHGGILFPIIFNLYINDLDKEYSCCFLQGHTQNMFIQQTFASGYPKYLLNQGS